MPSVASESHTVLPSRSHPPGHRNHAADRNEPATPFAELLDSTAPAPEPPPTQRSSRSRSERTERHDAPKTTDRNSDAKAAKDKGETKDSRASDETDGAKEADPSKSTEAATADTPKADDGEKAASVEQAKLDSDIAASADSSGTEHAGGELAAALADAAAQATPQATTAEVKITLAAPQAEASDADEFAAIAAASQGSRQGAGTKAADTEAGKPGTPATAGAAPATPDAATAQPGQDAGSREHGDKPAEFRHALADAAKPDGGAAAPANDTSASKASTQAMQHLGLTPATHGPAASAAAANSAVAAAAQPQTAPVPLAGVAVEIVSQAQAGNHRFEIRLDPPELGRIDVKLDVDRDGNVSTRLVVERADTLDLLKRDAAALERALQQAGLKTGDHGLDFQLRQHASAQDDTPRGGSSAAGEDEPAPLEAVRQGYGRMLGMGSGLDIRV